MIEILGWAGASIFGCVLIYLCICSRERRLVDKFWEEYRHQQSIDEQWMEKFCGEGSDPVTFLCHVHNGRYHEARTLWNESRHRSFSNQ